MSFNYIKNIDTFTVYHCALVAHLSSFKEIIHLYKKCTTQSLTYWVEQDLDYCLKYVHLLY